MVGIDLKEVADTKDNKWMALNVVDFATKFNILVLLPNKKAETAAVQKQRARTREYSKRRRRKRKRSSPDVADLRP